MASLPQYGQQGLSISPRLSRKPQTPPLSSSISARRISKDPDLRSNSSIQCSSRTRASVSEASTPTRMRMNSSRRCSVDTSRLLHTQGNAMKVFVRVRPFNEREVSGSVQPQSTVQIDDRNPSMITVFDAEHNFRAMKSYPFTRCFWSVLEEDATDQEKTRAMEGLCTMINTHLNVEEPPSQRRRRADGNSTPLPVSPSARGQASPDDMAEEYYGAGSNAVMAPRSVTHPPFATQNEVYQHVGKPILDNTLEGFNGCVFAYGQTGSGKTFTMMGYAPSTADIRSRIPKRSTAYDGTMTPAMSLSNHLSESGDDAEVAVSGTPQVELNELQGIIPRVAADLFAGGRARQLEDPSLSFSVSLSYYEIYNERVFDLIGKHKNGKEPCVRSDPNAGSYVDNLMQPVMRGEEDVARMIRKGMLIRHTAATRFNDHSSRSHAILTLRIVFGRMERDHFKPLTESKLNLVDLAGSERAGAHGLEGQLRKEGININLSLTTLGRVIDSLADLSQGKSRNIVVPYRDSVLTHALMDSLGGNSKTAMIATISPHSSSFAETLQTLLYASRAKEIICTAVINEDPQIREIKRLTKEVDRLQQILRDKGGTLYTREYVEDLERKCRQLEKRCADQEIVIVGLRAELCRAGGDDSLSADVLNADSVENGKASVGLRGLSKTAEKALLEELSQSQSTVEELRNALEKRGDIDPIKLKALRKRVKEQDSQLARLQLQVNQFVSTSMRFYELLTKRYLDFGTRLAMSKGNAFAGACKHMLLAVSSNASATVERVSEGVVEKITEIEELHKQALEKQAERHRALLRDALSENASQRQEQVEQDRLKILELQEALKQSKENYEENCARMQRDKETMMAFLSEQHANAREQHEQELKRMREMLDSYSSDRHGSSEALRHFQEEHSREIARLSEEHERSRLNKENEIARLRNQLEADELNKQSALMEKDRLRRAVERELAEAQYSLARMEKEKRQMELEYLDKVRALHEQQERLSTVSSSVLLEWESKSSNMEAAMCRLRALMHDADYMNFRQTLRDMAFRSARDYGDDLEKLGEKERQEQESLREVVSKAKRVTQEHSKTLQRFEQDVHGHLGFVRSTGSQSCGLLPSSESDIVNGNGKLHTS